MTTVNIKDAKNRLNELVRKSEKGEIVTITRNGEPVADLVPHKKKSGGLNFKALAAYKRKHGITRFFGDIPPDFDEPLAEDVLLKPLA